MGGTCYLTFSYTLAGKRINKVGDKKRQHFDDEKAYTLQGFIDHYRKCGEKDATDGELKELGYGRPVSIATYFMDRLRAIDRKRRDEAQQKHVADPSSVSLDEWRKYFEARGNPTWTDLVVKQSPISVDFMRPRM